MAVLSDPIAQAIRSAWFPGAAPQARGCFGRATHTLVVCSPQLAEAERNLLPWHRERHRNCFLHQRSSKSLEPDRNAKQRCCCCAANARHL